MVGIDTMLLCFCIDICCVVGYVEWVRLSASIYLIWPTSSQSIHPILSRPPSPSLYLASQCCDFKCSAWDLMRKKWASSASPGAGVWREGAWCRVGGGRMLTELRLMGCERVKIIQTLKQPLGQKHFYCARPVSCSRPVITLIM